MLLKYFYDKALAQASYMVGDPATGAALVIDPARDTSPYLQAAREEGLTITQVAETHIHADFVSGSRELAAQTGARLYLSGMGGAEWAYSFADEQTTLLRDGDCWMLGSVRIDVMHAPGHTPEHLIFQLTDTEAGGLQASGLQASGLPASSTPFALVTGDCLFVGNVGRPDLIDRMSGATATMEQGARQQFQNVQRLKQLPDYLQILPGHGAGSICGKALGSVPSSTLRYEKLTNPAFQFTEEAAFVAWLLSDQPEAPPYLAEMKRVNKAGAALLETLEAPLPMEGFILAEMLKSEALIIDARVDGAHVPGAVHILPDDKFSTYAGWFVDYRQPTYLVCAPEQVDGLLCKLRAIGVDNLPGYFTPDELGDLNADLPVISAEDAAQALGEQALLVDVRSKSEFDEEHAEGAQNIPYGVLPGRIEGLPADRMIIVYCASGIRSHIAASVLMKHGVKAFASVQGGLPALRATGVAVSG